jgi:ubiquinone biosynthesis protein
MHSYGAEFVHKKKQGVDFNRVKQIINVCYKHGLGYFVARLNVSKKLNLGQPEVIYKSVEELNATLPQRVRKILDELGPTYIKFGQILSTRPDLIGDDFAAEFSLLQDKVTPFDNKLAFEEIEKELGKKISDVFIHISEEPIASASLSQVYKGKLLTGEEVALKIQRPGVMEIVEGDVEIIKYLVKLFEKYYPELRPYNLQVLVDEFEKVLIREMDFQMEAKNISLFREYFKDEKIIKIPKIYPEFSTKKMLVMEFIHGKKLNEIISEFKANETAQKLNKINGVVVKNVKNSKIKHIERFDRKLIAERGAKIFFNQIFRHGVFHADPHPGNILILKNNVIGLLDFGMVGRIPKDTMNELVDLFLVVMSGDAHALEAQLMSMGLLKADINIKEFNAELESAIENYYGIDLNEIKIGEVLRDILKVLSKYKIKIPREYMLLSRSLLLIEGVGVTLYPKFNALDYFKPYATEVTKERFSLTHISKGMLGSFIEMQTFLKNLPFEINRVFDLINSGKITIEFEHRNLDAFGSTLDKIANKISISMILAAMLIGSAVILHAQKPPYLFGYPVFGLLGFLFSGVLALLLMLFSLGRDNND